MTAIERSAAGAQLATLGAEPLPNEGWRRYASLPMCLQIRIPTLVLSVRDVVRLRPGALVRTGVSVTDDVPVFAGGARVAQAEFENRDGVMAVRLTRVG